MNPEWAAANVCAMKSRLILLNKKLIFYNCWSVLIIAHRNFTLIFLTLTLFFFCFLLRDLS